MRDTILVINQNDSQTQAIIRKLRAEQIDARLMPRDVTLEQIKAFSPRGIIISGGITGSRKDPFDPKWLMAGLPVLALGDAALGLLSELAGKAGEEALSAGIHPVTLYDCPVLSQWSEGERYLHDVYPLQLSECLRPAVAVNGSCIGFQHIELPLFGLQLHVEQNDLDAAQVLASFALDVCLCTRWWDSDALIDQAVTLIRDKTGDGIVLLELTGGVDSGVCALLGHMAVGAQLKCYWVDTGLTHLSTGAETLAFFRDTMGLKVDVVEAKERFMGALQGLASQDAKELAISGLLHEIRLAQEERLNATVLLSPVNASDLITGEAEQKDIAAENIIAPIAQLFKDEVRRLGEMLELPPALSGKQPCPQTGLALRVGGEVTEARLAVLRAADGIWMAEVEQSGQGRKLWQHFAMLMPLNDSYVVSLRAVNLVEGGGVQAARLPYELLERVTCRILGEVPGVKRVMYDFTSSVCVLNEWP